MEICIDIRQGSKRRRGDYNFLGALWLLYFYGDFEYLILREGIFLAIQKFYWIGGIIFWRRHCDIAAGQASENEEKHTRTEVYFIEVNMFFFFKNQKSSLDYKVHTNSSRCHLTFFFVYLQFEQTTSGLLAYSWQICIKLTAQLY